MKASALGYSNQRGAQKGVAGDINFLAPGELDSANTAAAAKRLMSCFRDSEQRSTPP
jgi:hypothetical protein